MTCPALCFANKTPFTDQITVTNGFGMPASIQPGVPVTLTANVTNTGAGGLGQVLFFWTSQKRNLTWPDGVYQPNWVIPEIGSFNGEILVIPDGPCVVPFTTLWLPDNTVVPAAGANQTVLIVFAQIVVVPVLPVCAGSSCPSSFDLTNAYNGAAIIPYLPPGS